MKKLSRRHHLNGWQPVGGEVPLIERDKIADLRLKRQLCKSFVIRVRQCRLPKAGGRERVGTCTEGIKEAIHDGRQQAEARSFALEHFVLFREHRVADQQGELPFSIAGDDLKRRSLPRPQRSKQDIGIENSPDHRHAMLPI
ncbi:hypothetical protein [Prosthecobacter sp.]|uniref:hypothetical protein n=1 Tax=Prosthecobacter sp. TaxID=1965333 RepID=UPI0025E9A879|nr:hypothetical protein [Prosthecobacter sp.]